MYLVQTARLNIVNAIKTINLWDKSRNYHLVSLALNLMVTQLMSKLVKQLLEAISEL